MKPPNELDSSLNRAVLKFKYLKSFSLLIQFTKPHLFPGRRLVQPLQVENVPFLSSDAKKVDHGHSGIIGLGNMFLKYYRQKKLTIVQP